MQLIKMCVAVQRPVVCVRCTATRRSLCSSLCRSVIFCDQSLISSNMSVGFFSGRSVGFVFRYSGFLQQSKIDLHNIFEILMKLAYTTMHRLSVI
jgi:hypothetical protein